MCIRDSQQGDHDSGSCGGTGDGAQKRTCHAGKKNQHPHIVLVDVYKRQPENREDDDHQMDIPVESPEEELTDKIGLAEVLESLPEQDRLLIKLRCV